MAATGHLEAPPLTLTECTAGPGQAFQVKLSRGGLPDRISRIADLPAFVDHQRPPRVCLGSPLKTIKDWALH